MQLTWPKNASKAVLFRREPRPSTPFINAWLSFLGFGLLEPAIMYTPSPYAGGVFRIKRLSKIVKRNVFKNYNR